MTPHTEMPLSRPRNPQPDRDRPSRPRRAPASVRQAVDEAARTVLENRTAWKSAALNPGEAELAMERLVAVVTGASDREELTRDASAGMATLTLRLVDLVRHELLRDPRGLSDATLLDTVRRIEDCRIHLQQRSNQELTYLLTGANALELVVEFAHDLRSPLTSIMFLAETLRKGQSGELNEIQRDQLGIMYSAALGMVSVANDVMDMASSETDEAWGAGTDETFSIHAMVQGVRNMVAPMAQQKQLAIGFFTPQRDNRRGNPVLLSRVLLNLLTNAMKFTEQGRVDVVAEDVGGSRVRFSVADTGRGMSPERLEALFSLFDRSESRTGYHFSGTGLGLTMCRRMVEKMGGQLRVESRQGEGTKFSFDIELPTAG